MTDAIDAGPILLLEDDAELAAGISQSLELAGHHVLAHGDGTAALASIDARFAGVIVSDLRMPGMDGWQFFAQVKALDADLPVIFITGHGNIDAAVSALQKGAYDFLAKPFAPARLLASIARAMEKRRLVLDNRRLRAAADDSGAAPAILPLAGESHAMAQLRSRLAQLGDADIDLLIEGEAGTGRDRIARHLHSSSRRRHRPFAGIQCAGYNADELMSEIFGQNGPTRGRRRPGWLEQAHRGTLFIDGIEAMPAAVQTRLAGALDRGERMDGDGQPAACDVRLIAATGSEPDAAARLQPDLRLRLGGLVLRVPPLRERRDDIPLLFARLAAEAAARFAQPLPSITASIRAHLLAHDWPGNLRELAHYAERCVLGLAENADNVDGAPFSTLADRMARIEAGLLREALASAHGQIAEVQRALGLPRKTLYDKLARHGIDPGRYRRRG